MRPSLFFYGFQIRCRCHEGRLQHKCTNVRMDIWCVEFDGIGLSLYESHSCLILFICRLREDNLLQALLFLWKEVVLLRGQIFQLPGLRSFWTCTLQEHLLGIYQICNLKLTISIMITWYSLNLLLISVSR